VVSPRTPTASACPSATQTTSLWSSGRPVPKRGTWRGAGPNVRAARPIRGRRCGCAAMALFVAPVSTRRSRLPGRRPSPTAGPIRR
jgi:hypothetical protein